MWAGYEYWWHQKGEKGTKVWACRALLCSQSKINTTKTAQHASVTVHQLFTELFCSKFLLTRLLEDELERTVFVYLGCIYHLRLQIQIKVLVHHILLPCSTSASTRLVLRVQDIDLSMKKGPSIFNILPNWKPRSREQCSLSCFPHLSLLCFLKVATDLKTRRKHFNIYSYLVLILCQLCLLKP